MAIHSLYDTRSDFRNLHLLNSQLFATRNPMYLKMSELDSKLSHPFIPQFYFILDYNVLDSRLNLQQICNIFVKDIK